MNTSLNTRVMWSSALGATFAWYDFMVFNIAVALIFPKLFFPDMNYLIPILVFSVGLFARPIGSLIFGIIGDLFGRRHSLVLTLYITGLTTVMIGLLPTHADIGITATVLLITARILQSMAFGGEWSAAATMIVEHHQSSANRGLLTSLVSSGWPIATIMATLMFMLVNSFGSEFFVEYGWRIPFLFSVFLLLIGSYIRRRVLETPDFQAVLAQGSVNKTPLQSVIKGHSKNLVLGALAFQLACAWTYIIMIFGFGYVVQQGLVTRAELTQVQFLISWLLLIGILFWGWLSDQIGPKNVFFIGVASSLLLTMPIISWLAHGNIMLAYASILFVTAPAFATAPKLFVEQFPTQVRQTGSGITYHLGLVLGAGIMPLVAQQLFVMTGDLMFIAVMMFLLTAVAAVATAGLKSK